jgi:hypothetical protein
LFARAGFALVAGWLLGSPAPATARDRSYFWGWSPELDVPVTLKLTLLGFARCDAEQAVCLDVPMLTFGADLKRPSRRGGSVNLSFAQAPLVGFLTLGMLESESPALRTTGIVLSWLSGGSLRWAPGGAGNLRRKSDDQITLAFVLKNELALHPFVTPAYVRATPGLGLAISRLTWENQMPGMFLCGVGGFASFAAERHGARSFDPGVWLSCFLSGD